MSSVPAGPTYGTLEKPNVDSQGRRESVYARIPLRRLTWFNASWLVNASVLGIGVLCIPYCFAQLGWVLGCVLLAVCLLGNIFIAYLMREVQQENPLAITLADAAYFAAGRSEAAKLTVRWVLYAEKLAASFPAAALVAQTLGSSFYMTHWCHPVWCGVAFVLFMIFSQQKSLSETAWMNIANILALIAAVGIAAYGMVQVAPPGPETSIGLPGSVGVLGIFNAIATLVFAFSGNWMYFEVMAEMTKPQDFMKAFTIAGPVQLGLYAFIGVIGYAAWGHSVPTSIIDTMQFGPILRVVSFLLAVHVCFSSIISTQILVRFFHSRLSLKDLNEDTAHARAVRASLTGAIYSTCMLVAIALPSFGTLVAILGALFEAPISFVLPVGIYLGIMRQKGRRVPWSIWIAGSLVALCGLATTCLGLIGALAAVSSSTMVRPFSCGCEGMWDTCECSPHRMPEGTCVFEERANPAQALLPTMLRFPYYAQIPFHRA